MTPAIVLGHPVAFPAALHDIRTRRCILVRHDSGVSELRVENVLGQTLCAVSDFKNLANVRLETNE